jgi:hypothetical protein
VTEVGYQGSKSTQADVFAAQLSYTTEMQQLEVYRLYVENDRTQLNMLLYRRPDEPLVVDDKLDQKPLVVALDNLISRATETRQEILQAALAERNSMLPQLSPKWSISRTEVSSPARNKNSSSPRISSASKLLIRGLEARVADDPPKISEYYSRGPALIVDRAELAIRCVLKSSRGEPIAVVRSKGAFDKGVGAGDRETLSIGRAGFDKKC